MKNKGISWELEQKRIPRKRKKLVLKMYGIDGKNQKRSWAIVARIMREGR